MEYFTFGREALVSGLISLGLKKGDAIIVPAYICKSALQPILEHGIEIIFIDVDEQLSITPDSILNELTINVKAVLVVHYFGVIKNINLIIKICHNKSIIVVEDMSHSFLSRVVKKTETINSDMEIFSIRKSLPVLDGGGIIIHNDKHLCFKKSKLRCVTIIKDIKYLILRIIESIFVTLGIDIHNDWIAKIKNRRLLKIFKPSIGISSCNPSWRLEKYLKNKKYLVDTGLIIKNNYDILSSMLIKNNFHVFDIGNSLDVVPQALLLVEEEGGVVDYLKQKSIGARHWPSIEIPQEVSMNSSKYLNANSFNNKLVLLPVHQSITIQQIEYIVQNLVEWRDISKQ
jgi:dTDP-4-amino-4,6-dideoxygalactose transaminase